MTPIAVRIDPSVAEHITHLAADGCAQIDQQQPYRYTKKPPKYQSRNDCLHVNNAASSVRYQERYESIRRASFRHFRSEE
jgi:hypothetical protein